MLETSVKTPVNCKLHTYSPEGKFSTAQSRHLVLKRYHTIGSIECHFWWWIENVINLFVQKYSGKKKMACNPSLKSETVGCLGNRRWLMDPSTSRVTVHLLQQPGAHLNGDLEDSPMVDGERECRSGAGGAGAGGYCALGLPSLFVSTWCWERNAFISAHILVSVVTPREARADLSHSRFTGNYECQCSKA